jgi:hypothetical protein
MKISTFRSGLRGFWIFNSMPDEPIQRNVVFSPISGSPSCIHLAMALPLRTFVSVPAANQPTKTMAARKKSPRPVSGEMSESAIAKPAQWLSYFSRCGQLPRNWSGTGGVPLNDASGHGTPSGPGGNDRGDSGPQRQSLRSRIRDFFYGMTGWEFERQALEMRGALENVFLTVTLGDMLGLPILPPIYSLRLLPFVVPNIESWKRRVSRRRDLPESEEYDLHGV